MNVPANIPAFCPHCGADIRVDEPILLNGFSMYGDGYPLMYNGKGVLLTRYESSFCWTLLKAYPRMVKHDTLLLRLGSDSETNVLDVVVSRIRAKLRHHGVPNPIETMYGQGGFRWSLSPVAHRTSQGRKNK